MKLELKHLSPYLPYGLKIQGKKHRDKYQEKPIYTLNGLAIQLCGNPQYEFANEDELFFAMANDKEWKPVLRPLSDLTKEIEHNGENFFPLCESKIGIYYSEYPMEFVNEAENMVLSYELTKKLFEWHFDVFGLIEKGLAIDINTLNNKS